MQTTSRQVHARSPHRTASHNAVQAAAAAHPECAECKVVKADAGIWVLLLQRADHALCRWRALCGG